MIHIFINKLAGFLIAFSVVSVFSFCSGTGKMSKPTSKAGKGLKDYYKDHFLIVFEVFRKYRNQLTGVTFWNVTDRYSWLDTRGRKNYSLLFDTNHQRRKAYWDVVNFDPD
jgi:GH35 family endo-1,4-beta-xylanase